MKRWSSPIRVCGQDGGGGRKGTGIEARPQGDRNRGRSSRRGRREQSLWAWWGPRKALGWDLVEASVAPPDPPGAGYSPSWPHMLVRVPRPGLGQLLGKGVLLAVLVSPLPSLPTPPGNSGHQLSSDLVSHRLSLVQANSFHLRQVTLGGYPTTSALSI